MKLGFLTAHLVWMGIDPVEAVRPYVGRVSHAQAKDIELCPDRRTRYGWPARLLSREDPWDVGWWRYRVPELGSVHWRRVVDALYEGGFDGVLSVEHEDPVWVATNVASKPGSRWPTARCDRCWSPDPEGHDDRRDILRPTPACHDRRGDGPDDPDRRHPRCD
jgi:sugar phosphate isomerase/epimerase